MPTSKQRLVLVIDDEEAVQVAFAMAFKGQEEFLLDQARSVREAMERLAVVQYDIIFLDMRINENSWSGMQLLREINRLEIRARSRGQPVLESLIVIMSGSVPFDDFMAEAHELGVLVFLDKPVSFSPEFIRAKLQRLGLPLLPPQSSALTPPAERLKPGT